MVNLDKFAWPTVRSQFQTNSSITDPALSPLYMKELTVKCVDKNDLHEAALQNGRRCLENF